MPAELTPEERADAWEWFCTIHREAGRRYYVIWDEQENEVFSTLDRNEAQAAAAAYYVLWRDHERSHSVRTVSGGAFEMNRRRH